MPQNAKQNRYTDFWGDRFVKEGHIWGDHASQTARIVSRLLNKPSKIFEIGYGYGRDMVYLGKQGFDMHGVDQSEVGRIEALRLMRENALDCQIVTGDFIKSSFFDSKFDAVYSHRVLHLVKDVSDVKKFAHRTAEILKPNGLLVISARDPRDYNETQMRQNSDGSVEYINRPGHIINFWDENRYEATFGDLFNILKFKHGREIESVQNPIPTHFTTMIARLKSSSPQI